VNCLIIAISLPSRTRTAIPFRQGSIHLWYEYVSHELWLLDLAAR